MLSLDCQTCGAHLELEPAQRTGRCLYCASPAVVERPPEPGRPNPGFAVGFVVSPERAQVAATDWARRSWFAPEAFRRALVREIRGIYVPAYLYSAAAHSQFQAQIGEHYKVRKSDGKTTTKTEWRPLAGQHAKYITDHVVTASKGLHNAELQGVEPYDWSALHRYSAKLVSGWAAEDPSMSAEECIVLARHEALVAMKTVLNRFLPGDRSTQLRYQTNFEQEHLELVLLPVWVLPVRYHPSKAAVRLVINGQTGKIYGKRPVSWIKWAFVGGAILTFCMLCVLTGLVLQ